MSTKSTDPTESNWNREWRIYLKKPYFKPNLTTVAEVSACFDGKVKGKKIIELGAGSGSDIIMLAKQGAKAYAVDFSAESVKSINYWSKKMRLDVTAVKADIKKLPFEDDFFDLIYSVGLMEHFTDPYPYLKEQVRILKNGGFLVVNVPQKFTLYTIAKHFRMWRGTHPFGWETEYSKGELVAMAKKLHQPIARIYGAESDIIQKIPRSLQPFLKRVYSQTIEKTFLSPYVSLNIGLILKIKK